VTISVFICIVFPVTRRPFYVSLAEAREHFFQWCWSSSAFPLSALLVEFPAISNNYFCVIDHALYFVKQNFCVKVELINIS
jgi:hypothetical protein